MAAPAVVFLNHLKSSGMCQGIFPSLPMTRLRDIAAIARRAISESFFLTAEAEEGNSGGRRAGETDGRRLTQI
jgi:hypothetical protein